MSKTIWGVVSAGGSIINGTGFTPVNNQPGEYTVVFTPGFPGVPAVVATQMGNFPVPTNTDGVAIGTITPNSCIVSTGDRSGNAQNRDFAFIAIG
jgi:hypothetical protein